MAHIRQSRPDSGLGFQVEVFKTFQLVTCSLGSRGAGKGRKGGDFTLPRRDPPLQQTPSGALSCPLGRPASASAKLGDPVIDSSFTITPSRGSQSI